MKAKIYGKLLRLDMAVLKKDSYIIKVIKRKILKKIGFYFRTKYYNLVYKK